MEAISNTLLFFFLLFRDHVERVDDSLSPFTYTNFGKDVDKLQSLLDSLTKFYNVQVDTKTNITDPSVVGQNHRHI